MGAYVSREQCLANYNVPLNCSYTLSPDNKTALNLGVFQEGQFEGDPDIAGIGVLGAFLAVTAFSFILSILNTIWWFSKNIFRWKNRITREEKAMKKWELSIAGFFEVLVITCSDQQIFTGGAYAITLRYAKGCSISAYHYDIVANMLLLTCATHLSAVTIARHYWNHPYVAILRIVVTALVYTVTGILLSNQGVGSFGFPTEVPAATDTFSVILLPAACFQSSSAQFASSLQHTFQGSAADFFKAQIPGWTQYLVMFLFYVVAVFVSVGRFVRRGTGHDGRRKKAVSWMRRSCGFMFNKRILHAFFGLYLVAGLGIAGWTIVSSTLYIVGLRAWVDGSGWISKPDGVNPENDPASFGQLVPVLLIALTVFTFMQILSERLTIRRKAVKRRESQALRKQQQQNGGGGDGKITYRNFSSPNPGNRSQTPSIEKKPSMGMSVHETEIMIDNRLPLIDQSGPFFVQQAHAETHAQTYAQTHAQAQAAQFQVAQDHSRNHSRGRSITNQSQTQLQSQTPPQPTSPRPAMYSVFPNSSQSPSPTGSGSASNGSPSPPGTASARLGGSDSPAPPQIPRKSRSRSDVRRVPTGNLPLNDPISSPILSHDDQQHQYYNFSPEPPTSPPLGKLPPSPSQQSLAQSQRQQGGHVRQQSSMERVLPLNGMRSQSSMDYMRGGGSDSRQHLRQQSSQDGSVLPLNIVRSQSSLDERGFRSGTTHLRQQSSVDGFTIVSGPQQQQQQPYQHLRSQSSLDFRQRQQQQQGGAPYMGQAF
ncbi:hypothetical protein B0T17DRAFT_505855 [Bombardia bombarda]|uniref:Uncharacterized protein n=1 Tax=Bombardia bombarda TaxID=252184 RepID=A0AA40C9L2_9PEZI|nr:hypothetical protein B0T17DRAFT_505855 [Bombardia bombarda]